ncbi:MULTISPECIES: VOC family protein [unclassified Streptomyces]|uniref:VOC family protein n=1 Tax=unclassified Streptomyces TaxID=2593676 RepID=UPI002366DB49|nr:MULTISPECIES: VOC family protein [unclassified Streptomyces]MDF3147374.1 VOC family protein [Streptomyces sp. T21Q-yed]WDF35949.1 VOC family protein [Streptomyces sp. T12]
MARLHDIVIDCARPAATARFWAAALDGYTVAPYDDAELARLRAQGIADPEDDPTVLVEPRGGGPRLWCQLVPEPKRVKNRLHLDLVSADPETEIGRLVTLGASVQARHEDHDVLADPEGNEFCLFTLRP